MNINNSPHGPTVIGGEQIEPTIPMQDCQREYQNNHDHAHINSLRKSLPGSSAGLKGITVPIQTDPNDPKSFELQQQQQNPSSSNINRQSHSHSSHANPSSNMQAPNHDKTHSLSQSQQHNTYHSVAAQTRALPNNQIGLFVQNNQPKITSNAQSNSNYLGQNSQGNITALQTNGSAVGTAQGIKFQNQAILGVTNHGAAVLNNHNQFSVSTQQGLFPKISNLRGDTQSIPNSAHGNVTGIMQGQVKPTDTMNVLKNSGGHISGMSNHQTHQNLNKEQVYKGTLQNGAPFPLNAQISVAQPQQFKPLSSPRSSQQNYNNLQCHLENALTTDPNLLYQQQLQWKTQANMNVNTTEFQKSNTNYNEQGLSPITGGAQNGLQNQLDYQRAKQISSGSEKRLKLHQQRQYYSEQYRVQQQRQHQQTANAVLKQSSGPVSSNNMVQTQQNQNPKNDFNSSNSNKLGNINVQNPSGRQSQVEQINSQAGMQHSNQPSLTPQLYSQQKHKVTNQVGMSQSLSNTNQMLNNGVQQPLTASMAANGQQQQKNLTIQQQQQMSSSLNQSNNQFFKKRASSNNNPANQVSSPKQNESEPAKESTTNNQNISTQSQQNTQNGMTSPKSSQQQSQVNQNQLQLQSSQSASQSKQSTNGQGQQSTTATEKSASQQPPPKIPVICGFHKRILLITCQNNAQNEMQNGVNGFSGLNPNSSMSQARRIRNKNPNCNHNSNSVFYQPHYNNVKYDDSHKKKEDVLRKVFFKECAKEEEKRLYNGNNSIFPSGSQYGVTGTSAPNGLFGPNEMARQQAFSQANDPNKHLQIIERILCEYLFVSQPFDRNSKAQLTNTQSLMMELGLDRALTPHRAFLLALIRAGKFTTENMLKVLSEVKTSATEFDNECIYCKYSQYALKESAKLLQKHQQALLEQSQTNPQQALAAQQQIQANGGIIKGPSGEDIRIENLVRMFQSQLFKKSFINTSLMIIQRKMTEKYFQKYHNAKQAQQAAVNNDVAKTGQGAIQYGPDGKPLEQKKQNKKIKPKCTQNLTSLEYLAKEIQKLSKNLANPKDKERYLDLKEKYYREFLIKILKSNGVEKIQFPTASFAPYKYYIGRGNNSGIVRTALKSRFWWSMGEYDDWSDYNFIWTQWKSNKVLNCMKTWKEVQDQECKDAHHPDKKRSSQSTRAGGHIDSQLSTQATDKESTSSKENLITTPKKNKLASSTLGNNSSEPQFRKQITNNTNQNSATKNTKIVARGRKAEEKEDEKEENITSHNLLSYSKQENNYHLSNKKAIFYNMKVYYEAIGIDYHKVLPLSFHIKEGLSDPQFLKFEQLYNEANNNKSETILDQYPKLGKHLWIIKPGENTNRGCGIQVCKELDHIKNLIQNTMINGNKRSYIIQKYIEKPLLYKNRKFDIRAFTLMCTINGNLQGYWYQEGYFRTSCKEFTIRNISNRYVHLTNDALQKKLDDYGKYESGNKLSYMEFQKYLDNIKLDCDFVKDIVPKMRNMAMHSMRAVSRKVDPNRRTFSFEIYGYDFMIDEDLNPWMIEVNTNPCFELASPYLARLIPAMVENSLKIAVDPIFPPPPVPNSKKHQLPDASDNKFELIFNERVDANELKNLPIDDNMGMNGIIEEEEMEEEGSDDEEEEQQQE